MVVIKRKKNTRLRAKTTHGYGSMKKHRGAGHRGGRGRAGSGKRGDAKKPSYQTANQKGKTGFTSRYSKVKSINISILESRVLTHVSKKIVEEKSGVYSVNLKKLGYNKLLGTGKVLSKWEITVEQASKSAIDKIQKAGGKVILPAPAEKKPAETKAVKPAEPAEDAEEPAEPEESEELEVKDE